MNETRDDNFFDAHEEDEKALNEKDKLIAWMKLLDDMRWVLSTPKGRRVVWWILSLCGIFRISFVSKDANQTSFNEGCRDIGLRFLRVIQSANPKAYSQMQDEVLAEQGKKRVKEN